MTPKKSVAIAENLVLSRRNGTLYLTSQIDGTGVVIAIPPHAYEALLRAAAYLMDDTARLNAFARGDADARDTQP